MYKFHYEIIIDEAAPEIQSLLGIGEDDSLTINLNTNNRLQKEEILTLMTPKGAIYCAEIKRITSKPKSFSQRAIAN